MSAPCRNAALVSQLLFVQPERQTSEKLTACVDISLLLSLHHPFITNVAAASMSQNDGDLQRWLRTIKEVDNRLTSSERDLQSLRSDNSGLKSENARRKCDLDRIRAQRDRQQLDLEASKRKQSVLCENANLLQIKLDTQEKRLQHVQAEKSEDMQQALMFRSMSEASKAEIELKDVSIFKLKFIHGDKADCVTSCRRDFASCRRHSYVVSRRTEP